MPERLGKTVLVEIVEISGTGICPSGYEVGRIWTISDHTCPEGMCAYAFNSILPFVTVLQFGGLFPWSKEPTARVCCPDADNPVVFRISVED